MKRFLIIVGVIALLVAGYFGYQRYKASQDTGQTTYQTVTIAKGQLVALVGATGTVRANQSATLAWQITGDIGEVNVSIGDKVIKDQVLSSLSRQSLPQNIILAESDLINAQRALDDLKDNALAAAQADLAVVTAQKAYDEADRQVKNLNYGRGSQANLDVARATYLVAQSEVDHLQSIYNGMTNLPEDNPARALALSNLSESKVKRDRALANLNWFNGKPDDKEIREKNANLDIAKAQLDKAQKEYERLKNGADPKDIEAAQAKIDAIQATLNMAHLSAPFNGTISDVNIKPGDQVNPGTVSFRLDDLSHMLVDVQVSEVDINRIKVDQDVTLTFDAILNQEYQGKVIQVGRVGNIGQGTVNFDVTVELINPDANVLPGMTAAVNITVSQLDNVLQVPNRAVRTKNGDRVVYILENGVPTSVQIQLGASSDTMSEVVSGDIKAGDLVVLNPPTEIQAGGGPPSFMQQ